MKKRILRSLVVFAIFFCMGYVLQKIQVSFETREALEVWRCIAIGAVGAIVTLGVSRDEREH